MKGNFRAVLKYAGAFIAWVIGSGFATGQEILRFFTSYGPWSFGIVLINLAGFLLLGQTLLITGFEHREERGFRQYEHYCGKKLGRIYTWATPAILFLLVSVLISAAGSTLEEYYGVPHAAGSALMSAAVLGACLIGFDRFVRIISRIGPVVIVFTLLVGTITVIRDFHGIKTISACAPALAASQASPSWLLSSVLYLSLDFLTGGTYYTALGASAENRDAAKWGAVLGSAALVASIAVMNTAILLNGRDAAALAVPTLYLARRVSPLLGAAFSVILLLGMFSSCSAAMWSICTGSFPSDARKNRAAACAVSVCALIVGLLPFGRLVSVLYPLIGYYGLIYIGCVGWRGIRDRNRRRVSQSLSHPE
jgi:Uncharacterized membrane protein